MSNSTEVDFRFLSEPDIIKAGATDMARCIDVMEDQFKLLSLGDYRMSGKNKNSHGAFMDFPESSPFPNMPVAGPDRRFMAMCSYLGGSYNMCGLKWYGSNVNNREKGLPRSILTLMLNDPDTGAPLALMSANLISSYRTAAVPAVGVRYLARKDVHTVGIIGPGVMNKTTLRSFLMERPDIETVKVKGRGHRSLESYVDYVHQNFPSIKNVVIVDTEEEAIRDSDLVSVATNENGGIETYPRVKREWVKPGAFICAPSDLYADREPFIEGEWKCVTDLYPMYEDWRDEIGRFDVCGTLGNEWVDMVDYGMLPRERVVDLGDIVRGVDPGRTSEDDIYFFSIGGINTEDVSWGTTIYRKAVEMGLGQELKLWDAPALA
ncbi:tyramine oxidase subunit B [Collinsella aerofaciens]|uniref:Delta(1)-pyrroline-2-carboxylate reductase n=1 Tax=Collinsella aerofaciens TaxID=74426 RepID=A0A5K1IMN1_9ACTN|nr:tyramine oxidase subunit B [Collinsella aerofaciens]VWL89434.1 Delta(1)-pyrroline-2-carboxylate reductase [Collinsella aerofaciens]